MKVLVTGGAGFIGSNFVRHLLGHDAVEQVTVLDALTYAGNRANLADAEADDRFCFVRGDVCDRAAVLAAMSGHDSVVHFAAETHVDRSITGPDAFVRTNCVGTNVVIDVARELGCERVVHVSTDEVYGSIAEGSFAEADPLAPTSPYSASKAGSDLIALAYHSTHGVPVVVTRSSNNYGPFQFPEKLIPLFITNLLDGKQVPIYGDGRNVRDWIHVADNCRGVYCALTRGVAGEVYNIGGAHELTNIEITRVLLDLLGFSDDRITPVADRLGHDRRYSIDSSKIAQLGFVPTVEFADGIAQTVEWYRANEAWWRPLLGRR